ncbi:hypothetical protein [Aggregatibacter actinomycetemcomitans]|uniref:hypothetical protein n=1 Tax=Aggregatibacter actinomycetemcomitans TaxID=714 RepID=UPI00197B28C7|nr:hypothetical protein [Aggregatibacter actinomycetemcomitans]MBN6064267.1 hypothetical protein [Aggregatibacter actinomycetemcomitans]MBN6081713.1 hypothetical protein [Aggregatibacter actinomycetemcomitans]MBN6084110.1 hypothetical protein [Aggregatibacter actinomycetemcomitans]
MSEQQPKFLTALSSLAPIFFLLVIDIFALWLQPQSRAVSHLALGVLTAQLICLVVFIKGEICNGQRSRLSRANLYFALFWLVWFLLSFWSNYHYILTDFVSLCGLTMALTTWKQPQEAELRNGLLKMAGLIGLLGMLCYAITLFNEVNLQFNPLAQMLLGIILANLMLVIARNRLQQFIALLILYMVAFLALNAIFVATGLFHLYQQSAVVFANEFALLLYFALHVVIALILVLHVFKKWVLSYNTLFILFLIAASLPLWANFAYVA